MPNLRVHSSTSRRSRVMPRQTGELRQRCRIPVRSMVASLLLPALICLPATAGEWVAWYDDGRSEIASAVAADSIGNAYVVGYDRRSCCPLQLHPITVKYDADGNQLWAATYSTGLNHTTEPVAAADVHGNILVAGARLGVDLGREFLLVKYDADGQELWVETRQGSSSTGWKALAVDAEGSVYVTGTSGGDYLTVKYDANGNEVWTASYYGGPLWDAALDVSLDAYGHVYVTGNSERAVPGSPTVQDYLTVKYDIDGSELWSARYEGYHGHGGKPVSVRADALGNVYVTGTMNTGYSSPGTCFSNADCVWRASTSVATLAYDNGGNLLWEKVDGGRIAGGMEVDAAGNVYVVGNVQGQTLGSCNYNKPWGGPAITIPMKVTSILLSAIRKEPENGCPISAVSGKTTPTRETLLWERTAAPMLLDVSVTAATRSRSSMTPAGSFCGLSCTLCRGVTRLAPGRWRSVPPTVSMWPEPADERIRISS